MSVNTIGWEQDDDGIVVLTFDDPNQSVNTLNADTAASITAALDRLEAERATLRGVVLTSAKRSFFAGADLRDLLLIGPGDRGQITAFVATMKGDLRRLETLGVPVVAAINGTALGGGMEISLATHHRIVVDAPRTLLGLPEVRYGILPGAGGVVRTVRMFGIEKALSTILLPGEHLTPTTAHEVGLVDELVPRAEVLLPAAKAWVLAHPAGRAVTQPWEAAGYEIPGGTATTAGFAGTLQNLPARLRARTGGANYPAPHHIMAAAAESTQVDVDSAFEIETRYFVDLVTGPVARNMIQAFFFDTQQVLGSRGERPRTITLRRGGELAAEFTAAGIKVHRADRPGAPQADLVLDASDAFAAHVELLAPDDPRASRHVGFSLVPGTTIVEVATNDRTAADALDAARALARALGRVPIVTAGGRGPFTPRIMSAVLNEAIAMLAEGVPAATVDQAGAQAGFTTPPLELADSLGLETIRAGATARPAAAVLDVMVDTYGRGGQGEGGGFHDWDGDTVGAPWPDLREVFPPCSDPSALSVHDLGERLLFAGALEAQRCLDEGVVASSAQANVASILGAGFPGWTGGAAHYISHFVPATAGKPAGAEGFATRARELADHRGREGRAVV